jgi:PAS domain S-box-containing protein
MSVLHGLNNLMLQIAKRIIRWRGVSTDAELRSSQEGAPRHELNGKAGTFISEVSEPSFELIVNSTPALIWSARPDGQNEWVSRPFLEYVGCSPEQLRGWGWMNVIHPDDRSGIATVLKDGAASREIRHVEARIRRNDGEYHWCLFTAKSVLDEFDNARWYGISTDIEEQKRAGEQLRRSEAFLAEGQYLAQIGNFSWRQAANEIIWSDPLYRIFELDPAIPVTLDMIAARVHPDDIPLMGEMIERAQAGDTDFEYQHRILMPDSSTKCVHLIAHRVHGPPHEVEYIGAVLDVTQRRLSEEALTNARSELAHVARVMSLGTLTASIAHEVNQPLSGIITNAGTCLRMLAADPPNIEGARETARRTIRDGHRAADVIARLRALFSKRPTTIESVDLNKTALEVIALLRSDLCKERIVLSTELAGELPPARGDRVQLQQVIMNLLRNATDALSTIEGRPRLLQIRTELDDQDHIRLTVRDAGVGLQTEDTERIFDAFHTTKGEGMGMGLSISRTIIESHDGRLTASSNDGPGASFVFTIPAYRSESAGTEEAGPAFTGQNGSNDCRGE